PQIARRRRLRRGAAGRRRHHPGAGRGRADDHRLPAAQYIGRRAPPRGASPAGGSMIELFTTAFITLAVIIDPPGCAPIFASLPRGPPAAGRRRMAIRSAGVAWGILMFFALLGEPLLRTLGISLS